MPVYRQKREYAWYVRDGLHVRSPVRFDGVAVGDEDRKKYEDDWAQREREPPRAKDKKAKEAKRRKRPPKPSARHGPDGATAVPTPRFVSEAYFMDFKFEPGNYYLAGREQLDGQQVLRIEYYPKHMFDDSEERRETRTRTRRRTRRERDAEGEKTDKEQRDFEQRIERQMNKTALVTLWVDPAEHQIVKYTFDNVWMDFLPGGLARQDRRHPRVDDDGTTVPGRVAAARDEHPRRRHDGHGLARGGLRAPVLRLQGGRRQDAHQDSESRLPRRRSSRPHSTMRGAGSSGPFVPDADPQQEVIAEIRVHGNAYLRDEEVIKLAGISLGQPLAADGIAAIEQRLKASGHFDSVEVRKRYRSLDSTTDVALILLVHERAGLHVGNRQRAAGDIWLGPASRAS